MKKRKIAIAAFLLCAVMAIGIGYAATTGALNIVGTMVATEEDYKVIISAAEVDGTLPAGVSVTFDGQTSLSGVAVNETGFNIQGINDTTEVVTLKYSITNNNAFTMQLTPTLLSLDIVSGESSAYDETHPFIVTIEPDTDFTIDSGETTTFKVVIKLRNEMATGQQAKIKIHFYATSDITATP